jgi:hypothetical protein
MAAGVKLFVGAIAALNPAGYLAPITGAGMRLPCLVEEAVDNTGGPDGGALVRVHRGVVGLDLGDGIDQSALGTLVYFEDDHTVTTTADGSPAGILLDISDGQAWVDLYSAAACNYPIPPDPEP